MQACRRYRICFIFLMLLSMVLQGCKGSEAATAQLEEAFVQNYSKTTTDLQITPDYIPHSYFMDMDDSQCYFMVEQAVENKTGDTQEQENFREQGDTQEQENSQEKDNSQEQDILVPYGLYSQSLDGMGEPKLLVQTEAPYVLAFHLYSGESEAFLCVLAHNGDYYVLTEYDTAGAVQKQFELKDEDFVKNYVSEIRRCSNGSYMAYNGEVLFTFDDTGHVSKAVECPGTFFRDGLVLNNDTAYIIYGEESDKSSVLTRVDVKSGILKESYNIPVNVSSLVEDAQGKLYFLSNEALYDYDISSRKVTKKLELSVYGIRFNEVMAWSASGEVITLLNWEAGNGAAPVRFVTLEPKSEEQLGEEQSGPKDANKYDADGRRIITLYDPTGLLEDTEAIVDFNKYNAEYNVQLVGVGNYNYETLLAASDSPDLICLTHGNQVERYQQSGYLEDLKPFMEKSEYLSPDDLLESVAEYFTYDGGLYAFAEGATLGTLMCPESQVDGRSGWTVDEFLTWMAENPDVKSSMGLSKRNMLEFCLKGNMESYVDFEQGKADFTGEDFKRMLSGINNLQPDENGYRYNVYAEYDANDTHLFDEFVNDVQRIAELERVYGESLVNMGYPCDSGEPKVLLDCYLSLSMLSRSECKEGAYAFLEHYLMYDSEAGSQGKEYSARLRTLKSRMEKEWEAADTYTYILNGDNPEKREVLEFEIKQETKDKVRAMLENAQRDTLENYLIRGIIQEEAEAYFQGQKDLDTVCEIMQSRVNILLSERR